MTFGQNDIEIFNEAFKNYKARYIRFATSYVKNEQDAEDIVMESFMNFWEKRTEIKTVTNIYAYILSIVKNKAINYLEHQQIVSQALEKIKAHEERELSFRIATLRECNPEDLFSEDLQAIIDKTLQSLSEQKIKIFNLSRIENKSNKEIAEILDISVKTVEYHITETLKVLREGLKDYLTVFLLFLLIR
jgi:RNA polymerase sigma-70 factor (ECF subfamily)